MFALRQKKLVLFLMCTTAVSDVECTCVHIDEHKSFFLMK